MKAIDPRGGLRDPAAAADRRRAEAAAAGRRTADARLDRSTASARSRRSTRSTSSRTAASHPPSGAGPRRTTSRCTTTGPRRTRTGSARSATSGSRSTRRGSKATTCSSSPGDNLFDFSLPRYVEWWRSKPQPASAVAAPRRRQPRARDAVRHRRRRRRRPDRALRREAERPPVDPRATRTYLMPPRARPARRDAISTRATGPDHAGQLPRLARGARAGLRLPLRGRLVRHRGQDAAARGGQPAAAARRAARARVLQPRLSRHARATVSRPSVGRCSICSCRSAAWCAAAAGGSSAPGCRDELQRIEPPLCARCGAPTAWPVERCRECAGRRLAFASARAAVGYDAAARAARRAWKERGLRRLAAEAAQLVAERLPRPEVEASSRIVPADRGRRLERGHNPAERLAAELAALWELPCLPLLERTRRRSPARQLALPSAGERARRLPRDRCRAPEGRRDRRRLHDRRHRSGGRECSPRRGCTPGRDGHVRTRTSSWLDTDAVTRLRVRVRHRTARPGEAPMQLQVKGKNLEVNDSIRSYVERKLAEARPPRARADARSRSSSRSRGTRRSREPGRRGDGLHEGPYAAGARDRPRHEGGDRPARRQARAAGQALPGEARRGPQPARGASTARRASPRAVSAASGGDEAAPRASSCRGGLGSISATMLGCTASDAAAPLEPPKSRRWLKAGVVDGCSAVGRRVGRGRHGRRHPRSRGDRVAVRRAPDGTLIVDEESRHDDARRRSPTPSSASCRRRTAPRRSAATATLWAVAARRIEVVELPGLDGEELELASTAATRSSRVDGEPRFGSIARARAARRGRRRATSSRPAGSTATLWEVERAGRALTGVGWRRAVPCRRCPDRQLSRRSSASARAAA